MRKKIPSEKYVDVKALVLKFNEFINNHDVDGLASLMTKDHTFISRLNDVQQGKEDMVKAWESFFKIFPKYRNVIHFVYSKVNFVIMVGKSEMLEGPAIWTAYVNDRDNLISEWRVYDDTEKSRSILGIDEKLMAPAIDNEED